MKAYFLVSALLLSLSLAAGCGMEDMGAEASPGWDLPDGGADPTKGGSDFTEQFTDGSLAQEVSPSGPPTDEDDGGRNNLADGAWSGLEPGAQPLEYPAYCPNIDEMELMAAEGCTDDDKDCYFSCEGALYDGPDGLLEDESCDGEADRSPMMQEQCDGLDNDCNGQVDDDVVIPEEACLICCNSIVVEGWWACVDGELVCQGEECSASADESMELDGMTAINEGCQGYAVPGTVEDEPLSIASSSRAVAALISRQGIKELDVLDLELAESLNEYTFSLGGVGQHITIPSVEDGATRVMVLDDLILVEVELERRLVVYSLAGQRLMSINGLGHQGAAVGQNNGVPVLYLAGGGFLTWVTVEDLRARALGGDDVTIRDFGAKVGSFPYSKGLSSAEGLVIFQMAQENLCAYSSLDGGFSCTRDPVPNLIPPFTAAVGLVGDAGEPVVLASLAQGSDTDIVAYQANGAFLQGLPVMIEPGDQLKAQVMPQGEGQILLWIDRDEQYGASALMSLDLTSGAIETLTPRSLFVSDYTVLFSPGKRFVVYLGVDTLLGEIVEGVLPIE